MYLQLLINVMCIGLLLCPAYKSAATPVVPDALTRAMGLLEQGAFSKCLQAALEAERLNPDSAEPSFVAGMCAERAGRFQLALNEFSRSVQIDPANADSHYNLVVLAIKLVKIARAEFELGRFRRSHPDDDRIEELASLLDGLRELRRQTNMSDTELRSQIRQIYLAGKRSRTDGN